MNKKDQEKRKQELIDLLSTPRTIEEIQKHFGITRTRAFQILKRLNVVKIKEKVKYVMQPIDKV